MSRFLLALRCFFAVLFRFRLPADAVALLPPPDLTPPTIRELPEGLKSESEPESPAPQADVPSPAATVSVPAPSAASVLDQAEGDLRRRGAIQLLSILQREGRLVDFLMEDVSSYDDAQIGAAVRDIHRGCKKGLVEHLQITPVRPEPDEAAVKIEGGYNPSQIRLIGNITGRPPFHGTLRHHGWTARSITLPDLPKSHDPLVITPAEVELGG